MPKVVSEYREQARARILAAARTVFRRRGFRTATMEDIAREIGVSKGALYVYYRNKSALLTAIQADSRDRVLAQWEAHADTDDVADVIASSLDEIFAGEVDPAIWLELLAESSTNPQLRAALRKDHLEDIRQMTLFLERLEQRGRIRRVKDRLAVAEIINSLLEGAALELLMTGKGPEAKGRLLRSLRYVLPS
jgi:AcrR family transcriptional regulator